MQQSLSPPFLVFWHSSAIPFPSQTASCPLPDNPVLSSTEAAGPLPRMKHSCQEHTRTVLLPLCSASSPCAWLSLQHAWQPCSWRGTHSPATAKPQHCRSPSAAGRHSSLSWQQHKPFPTSGQGVATPPQQQEGHSTPWPHPERIRPQLWPKPLSLPITPWARCVLAPHASWHSSSARLSQGHPFAPNSAGRRLRAQVLVKVSCHTVMCGIIHIQQLNTTHQCNETQQLWLHTLVMGAFVLATLWNVGAAPILRWHREGVGAYRAPWHGQSPKDRSHNSISKWMGLFPILQGRRSSRYITLREWILWPEEM